MRQVVGVLILLLALVGLVCVLDWLATKLYCWATKFLVDKPDEEAKDEADLDLTNLREKDIKGIGAVGSTSQLLSEEDEDGPLGFWWNHADKHIGGGGRSFAKHWLRSLNDPDPGEKLPEKDTAVYSPTGTLAEDVRSMVEKYDEENPHRTAEVVGEVRKPSDPKVVSFLGLDEAPRSTPEDDAKYGAPRKVVE